MPTTHGLSWSRSTHVCWWHSVIWLATFPASLHGLAHKLKQNTRDDSKLRGSMAGDLGRLPSLPLRSNSYRYSSAGATLSTWWSISGKSFTTNSFNISDRDDAPPSFIKHWTSDLLCLATFMAFALFTTLCISIFPMLHIWPTHAVVRGTMPRRL